MSGFLAKAESILGYGATPSDEVSIILGKSVQISGWQSVTIRTSVEVMPSTFELEATETAPGSTPITVTEGSPCKVLIGSTVVLTGYVVTVLRSVDSRSHTVRIIGAARSVDLVECSAIFSTYQINNTDALSLARTLCQPFCIQPIAVGTWPTVPIPQFDVILTETPYEIIERISRFSALMVYDSPDGNICLGQAGTTLTASGFTEGVNVERYACSFGMQGRFRSIRAILQNTDTLFRTPNEPDLGGQLKSVTATPPLEDPGVPRYRPLLIPAEMGDAGSTVTKQRVQWEINRRWGRANSAAITCDRWRDDFGVLWAVNTLAPVFLPGAKCIPDERWLIGEVVFRRDADGTHADIVLMPKEAYQPEPVLLNPLAGSIAQAERDNAGAAPGAPVEPQDQIITTETLAPPGRT